MCCQGHELTLRVLYRLYGEAEEDHDFFSSTNAKSVYENFLLKVVCVLVWLQFLHLSMCWMLIFFSCMQAGTLRDSFPASDKSLSRLLTEVPYLPESILKLLECLCSPGSNKDEELHRLTQGLSIVWNLILLRPPIRNACLQIALQVSFYIFQDTAVGYMNSEPSADHALLCFPDWILP